MKIYRPHCLGVEVAAGSHVVKAPTGQNDASGVEGQENHPNVSYFDTLGGHCGCRRGGGRENQPNVSY